MNFIGWVWAAAGSDGDDSSAAQIEANHAKRRTLIGSSLFADSLPPRADEV